MPCHPSPTDSNASATNATVYLPMLLDINVTPFFFLAKIPPRRIRTSLRMTINKNQRGSLFAPSNAKAPLPTIILSAIGSIIFPSSVTWLNLRAKYPSRKSVSAPVKASINTHRYKPLNRA